MSIPASDKDILRRLVSEYAVVATLPVHKEKAELWRKLNRLESVRPMVWINEIPWHEMNVNDELTLQCTDEFCRGVENGLRMTLYQWRHLPADMVIEPVLYSSYVCGPTSSYADYGIKEEVVTPDGHGSAVWRTVIHSVEDADQIRTPEVCVDWDATERNYQRLCEICDGLIPVEKRGIVTQWCSPWDQMIHWISIEELYFNMIEKPEVVHRMLQRFMKAVHEVLDKQEELGLLSVSDGNHRVGSGGLGITDELPQPDFDPIHVRPIDQWGSSTGQIFSEVSPDMHEEFCLQYERPYMERFGLSCYGCCEPLHLKMGILRKAKNLRRVSMSPFIKLETAVENVGADYIFSSKPTPAIFADDGWDPALARRNLAALLEQARGCHLEFIMKDVSTVRNQPQRLWEWSEIAMDLMENEA